MQLLLCRHYKLCTNSSVTYILHFCDYLCLVGQLILFCADTELSALYSRVHHLWWDVRNGTGHQAYTIDGYVYGESLALAWALQAESNSSELCGQRPWDLGQQGPIWLTDRQHFRLFCAKHEWYAAVKGVFLVCHWAVLEHMNTTFHQCVTLLL